MQRVALVAPIATLRDVLRRVADAAVMQIDRDAAPHGTAAAPTRAGGPAVRPATPLISAAAPDLEELERCGRYDLLAGEAELQTQATAALRRSNAAALVGWVPVSRLPEMTAALTEAGGAVVPLARSAWSQAPTLLAQGGLHHELTPLVQTYGTVPYSDLDPSWLA
jgi:V/A-type H+-transporting ATPase subunit I